MIPDIQSQAFKTQSKHAALADTGNPIRKAAGDAGISLDQTSKGLNIWEHHRKKCENKSMKQWRFPIPAKEHL